MRAVEEPVLSVAEGTPAMLVGRCSSDLSGHRPQGKLKSHSLRAQPTCPGVPWRDLQFPPALDALFTEGGFREEHLLRPNASIQK